MKKTLLHHLARLGTTLLLASFLSSLSAEPREPVGDGLLTAVVGPGGGTSCSSTPCAIYYRVPDLGSSVEVVVNNFTVGTFPSGKTASLGNYNDSVRITVRGRKDVPTAYVRVPGGAFR